jgi:hypothetical protein
VLLHHPYRAPHTTGHRAFTWILTPLLCKFGPGFYRRHPTQISNPRADVIKAHGTEWAARAQTINEVHVCSLWIATLLHVLTTFSSVWMRSEPSGDVEDDGQQVPLRPHHWPGTSRALSRHLPLSLKPPLGRLLCHVSHLDCLYPSLPPFIFQPRPYEVRLPVSDKAIGKRIHGEEGLGPEAPHRGNAELRESRVGRFFMPLPGGKNHHYRQVHTEPQTQHSLRRYPASGSHHY